MTRLAFLTARRTHARGFTLIELMIVVVVIGVLASLALPKFNRMSRSAKEAEADLILKEVYTLQQGYYSHFGRYATANELDWRGLPNELSDGDIADSQERYYYIEITSPTTAGTDNTGYCAVAQLTAKGTEHGLQVKSMGSNRIITASDICA